MYFEIFTLASYDIWDNLRDTLNLVLGHLIPIRFSRLAQSPGLLASTFLITSWAGLGLAKGFQTSDVGLSIISDLNI